jgi:pSer/pThr/pTyr-binding forkhead associated (FHA) protein
VPRLVITKGEGVGRDLVLAGECVVGRGTDVDFVLTDTLASRRHVRLSEDAGAWIAEDLGSRNGTLLNGQRVQRQGVRDGDVLRVGGTEMIFRDETASAAGAARGAVVVPAVAVPRAVTGTTPPAPGAGPAKKPLPKVVPGRRRP